MIEEAIDLNQIQLSTTLLSMDHQVTPISYYDLYQYQGWIEFYPFIILREL